MASLSSGPANSAAQDYSIKIVLSYCPMVNCPMVISHSVCLITLVNIWLNKYVNVILLVAFNLLLFVAVVWLSQVFYVFCCPLGSVDKIGQLIFALLCTPCMWQLWLKFANCSWCEKNVVTWFSFHAFLILGMSLLLHLGQTIPKLKSRPQSSSQSQQQQQQQQQSSSKSQKKKGRKWASLQSYLCMVSGSWFVFFFCD